MSEAAPLAVRAPRVQPCRSVLLQERLCGHVHPCVRHRPILALPFSWGLSLAPKSHIQWLILGCASLPVGPPRPADDMPAPSGEFGASPLCGPGRQQGVPGERSAGTAVRILWGLSVLALSFRCEDLSEGARRRWVYGKAFSGSVPGPLGLASHTRLQGTPWP